MHEYMYVCIVCIYMCVHASVYMYVCIYICICAYMYVTVCIYIILKLGFERYRGNCPSWEGEWSGGNCPGEMSVPRMKNFMIMKIIVE